MFNPPYRNSKSSNSTSQVAVKMTKSSSVQSYSDFHSPLSAPPSHSYSHHSSQCTIPYNPSSSANASFSSLYARQDYFVSPPLTQTFVTSHNNYYDQQQICHEYHSKTPPSSVSSTAPQTKASQNCLMACTNMQEYPRQLTMDGMFDALGMQTSPGVEDVEICLDVIGPAIAAAQRRNSICCSNQVSNRNSTHRYSSNCVSYYFNI